MSRGAGTLLPEGTVFVAVAWGEQEVYLPPEHVIVPRGWHELKRHVGGFDFVAIKSQDFVVEDLVLRLNALVFHPCEGAATCQNHLTLLFVIHRLHSSGVAVDVMEEHLILVAAAGA